MRVAVFAAMVAVAMARGAQAQTIFADGFEQQGAAWTSAKGTTAYPQIGCRSGSGCGAKTLAAGSDQASVFWSKTFTHAGPTLYASAWYKFPVGYNWNASPKAAFPDSLNHKLMIFDTADGIGRFHVVLTGAGTSPTFFLTAEGTDPKPPGIRIYSEVHWPTDGAWHRVELELQRAASGRVRLWLDGVLRIDEAGRTCTNPTHATCAPIVGMQMGAYVNQGSAITETFFMDDVLVSASPRGAGPVVVDPGPVAPTRSERLNLALTAYAEALEALDVVGEQLEELKALEVGKP